MQTIKIKSIKKIECQSKKYDITTERNHNFFANGILVHNSNSVTGYVLDGDKFVYIIASHNVQRRITEEDDCKKSIYQLPLQENVKNCLQKIREDFNSRSVLIYSELFGKGMQDLTYGIEGVQYRTFDISVDTKYLDFEIMKKYCEEFNIPIVPILYQGPFSLDIINQLVSGSTTFGNFHMREGIVIKPVKERFDRQVGRVILKYINNDYLLRKGGSESH